MGIRVFGLKLPSRVAGLFIGSTAYGGCIAFNIGHPFERQRWTISHEYGHFLSQRTGTEVTLGPGSYERAPARERFADAFAENFLMPASGIMRRFHEIALSRPAGLPRAILVNLAALPAAGCVDQFPTSRASWPGARSSVIGAGAAGTHGYGGLRT